jgi:hypothetical protein
MKILSYREFVLLNSAGRFFWVWTALLVSVAILPFVMLIARQHKIPLHLTLAGYLVFLIVVNIQGRLKQKKRAALNLPPTETELKLLALRAPCLVKFGKHQLAIKDYDVLIRADPASQLYLDRALAHEALGHASGITSLLSKVCLPVPLRDSLQLRRHADEIFLLRLF